MKRYLFLLFIGLTMFAKVPIQDTLYILIKGDPAETLWVTPTKIYGTSESLMLDFLHLLTDTSFTIGKEDSLVKPGVVIGSYNTAAGNYSFLFGLGNKSEPPFSTIFGLVDSILGTATYTKNTIFGSYNTINNKTRETVIAGYNNRADTSSYGAILGHTCRLNNSGHGVAIGHNAVIDTSDYAICIGDDPNVTMDYGIAIGHHAAVDDTGGIALGFRTCVSHPKSVVIGWQDTTTASYQVKLGDEEYTTLIEGKADIAYMTADSLALTDTIVKFEEADSHLYITMSNGLVYQCVDTMEKWVSEARVDTIDRLMLDLTGFSVTATAGDLKPDGIANYYLRLNADDWWIYGYEHIDADSAILDSVIFHYAVYLSDADTFLFGFVERQGWDDLDLVATFTDTVVHTVSATFHEMVVPYDFSIPKRDRQKFPILQVMDCSNTLVLIDIILCYHIYHKRRF